MRRRKTTVSKIDMAAKRRKKRKTKISWLVVSMCYNEKKIEILTFYEFIKLFLRLISISLSTL